MNHIHRTIFNRALGVYQAVSETASSGRSGGAASSAACVAVVALLVGVAGAGKVQAQSIRYWDGSQSVANGVVDGGTGSWWGSTSNWTSADGTVKQTWANDFGVFQGTAGTVTVQTPQLFTGLQFLTDGYNLVASGSGQLTAIGATTMIRVDPGVTAVIGVGIDGGGKLAKLDNGTLVLTGANSYTGGTDLQGGTLVVGSNTALGTGLVTASTGATLDSNVAVTLSNAMSLAGNLTVGGSNALVLNGAIGGAGGLIKNGAASLTLGGNNNFMGAVSLTAGGLILASNSALGAGGLNASGGTTLDAASAVSVGNVINLAGNLGIGGTSDLTLNGAVNGIGSLTKNGAANLTLNGSNGFLGGFTLNAGTLTVGNGLALGLGNVTVGGASTLDNSTVLSLGNNVTLNASLAVAGSNDLILGGVISGAGILSKNGSANLTLNGVNTYSGGTSLNAGTLTLGVAGALGSSALTVTGASTLDNSAALVLANNLQVNAALAVAGTNNLSLSGVLAGAATLTKNGAADLSLGGNNTFSGNFDVQGGSLSTTSTTALGNNATMNLGTGTQLNLGASAGLSSLTGSGTALLGAGNTLSLGGGNQSSTFAGTMTGTGALSKIGTGDLILSGTSNYTGGTTVSAGTLQGNTASLQGDITNNASITFNQATLGTYAGILSGNGRLNKTGAGALVLSGANVYTGGTSLNSGTLQAGAANTLSGASTVVLANTAGATLDLNNFSQTIGSLSGGGTAGGNVALGSATLTTGGDNTATSYAGAISGSGGLTKTGTGTQILSGTNNYTGGTTVSGGTLQGNTTSLQGNITNNAAISFDQATSGTYAGTMTGTGALSKIGTGSLILSGTSNYTGATTINAGTLFVNGAISGSAVTVNSGGILGGSGTVGNTSIASGGVLAPGNSIGTLTVNGNLGFAAGSIYRVETDAAGNADRVNVNGNLALGGTVDVQAGAGTYARDTSYTLLTNTGTQTGTFAGVSSNLAFLTPTLRYLANAVSLTLTSSTTQGYSSVAVTPNQINVANYLNLFALAPGNAQAAKLIQQIDNLSAAQARQAFDALSGNQHTAAGQIAASVGRNFSSALGTRSGLATQGSSSAAGFSATQYAALPATTASDAGSGGAGAGLLPARSEGGLWAQAMGGGGRSASDGNGVDSNYRANGFVLGLDRAINTDWLAGAALSYSRTDWDANTRGIAPANGKIDSPQAGLYARYASGAWQLKLDGSYANHSFDTSRTVAIGNASAIASSSHHGTEWGAGAELEYTMNVGNWQLKPLAGLRHTRLSEDGFTETGAAGANLTVAGRRTQNTIASAGMKFVRPLSNTGDAASTGKLELRAVASHLIGDNNAPISARLAGQAASFTSTGTPIKRSALTLGATASGQISRTLSGYADAAYEYRGSGQNAFILVAGLKMAW
ncbi:autotransporter domain-containing protein [Polaromonas sp. SM01]|uniref:autotransporter domain-containing protein n=1 Tax=Polaromonas sp. SM01 TaxID=3085630 RepID=UPI0029828AC4|nr:autotransporter domain-containing protein [Polaromonas sp. SM01]MDW5442308.1 autotransporter domain-containing protein [Polaromonas sp. SM01]